MCSLSLAAGGLYFRSPKFDTLIDHIGWEALEFAPVPIRIPARIFYGVFCQDVDLHSNTIMVKYNDYSSAQSKRSRGLAICEILAWWENQFDEFFHLFSPSTQAVCILIQCPKKLESNTDA